MGNSHGHYSKVRSDSKKLQPFVLAELVPPTEVVFEDLGLSTYRKELKASIHPESVLYPYYANIYNAIHQTGKKINEDTSDVTIVADTRKAIIIKLGTVSHQARFLGLCGAIIATLRMQFIVPTASRMRYFTVSSGKPNELVCLSAHQEEIMHAYGGITNPLRVDWDIYEKCEARLRETLAEIKVLPVDSVFTFTNAPVSFIPDLTLEGSRDVPAEYLAPTFKTKKPISMFPNGAWAFGDSPEQKLARKWLHYKKLKLKCDNELLQYSTLRFSFTDPSTDKSSSFITCDAFPKCPAEDRCATVKKTTLKSIETLFKSTVSAPVPAHPSITPSATTLPAPSLPDSPTDASAADDHSLRHRVSHFDVDFDLE